MTFAPPCATRLTAAWLVLSMLGSGCALGGRADRSAAPFSGRELTAIDLEAASGARNLYEGIARLRPHFLRLRRSFDGSAPTVYLNGTPAPSIEVLREVRIEQVQLVRLLEAAEATLRYGSTFGNGILEVTTRGPGDQWR